LQHAAITTEQIHIYSNNWAIFKRRSGKILSDDRKKITDRTKK